MVEIDNSMTIYLVCKIYLNACNQVRDQLVERTRVRPK